ncbi:uncharacterized protein LOC112688956 [Sipha flava]|jgi:hypothetical protein|uniref:Uncharacterized protein LOC112688956 n=1 Tax=Sipha flava TaxID=143950 RepID=A0A8B8G6J2_9HEMI|nr:uncharacterized protein LOC112688956 [Sipha flava]
MVCVPCVLVPLLLFLWGIIKPMLNWFRTPVKNAENQSKTDEDQICSMLSSCPCYYKNKSVPDDKIDESKDGETLQKTPLEVLEIDKKNI